jgi:hypothetical protein
LKLLLFVFITTFLTLNSYSQACKDSCTIEIPKTINRQSTKENGSIFNVLSDCPVQSYEITIKNRWGQILFTSKDPSKTFDCKSIKGLEGSFYCLIEGVYCNGKKYKIEKDFYVF